MTKNFMPDVFISKNSPAAKTANTPPDTPNTNVYTTTDSEGHLHLLSSFCSNPLGVAFRDQEPDEKVLLFLRRHFITNFSWILTTIILFLLPFILIVLNVQFSIVDLSILPMNLKTAITLFYYLTVFSYGFTNFVTWYFNISLVTTERVVDIDYSDIVYKNIAATKLDLVQDASFVQIGVFAGIFNYGDVLVQTAGTLDNFDFFKVPHPDKVVNIIEGLIGQKNHDV